LHSITKFSFDHSPQKQKRHTIIENTIFQAKFAK